MAKKRSSLRGKGPGSSGAGEEKGKGIDLLFGGTPPETDDEDSSVIEGSISGERDEAPASASGAHFAPPPPPPPVPDAVPVESLPVPQPAEPSSSDQAVDEFGLPLAMEQPPADLELASPPTETSESASPEDSTLDATLPSTDLEPTLPPLDPSLDSGEDDTLSLDLGEDDLSDLDGDFPASSGEDFADLDGDLSDLDTPGSPAGDLGSPTPGSAPAPPPPTTPPPTSQPVSPAEPTSPPPPEPITPPPVDTTPPSEPMTPAPVDIAPPTSAPSTPPPPTPTPNIPSASTPPPTTPTPPPQPPTPSIAPPRARIDSIGGIVSEKIQVVEKDILPDDTKFSGGPISGVLSVAERADIEQNELITQKVTRYIGRERREKLDKEIEALYDKVADELSVNTQDTEFALRTLSQAQDIIFEDARQYDEALYRVAVVKTMLTRKNNLRRWSYTWGTAVFFYAIIWLVAFITGFILTDVIRGFLDSAVTSESSQLVAIRAAWFSALAGGIGGVIGILYSLYWHVSIKQDFDRQYVMYYFVQPVMGFILGALVYFIIGAGFLVVNFSSNTGAEAGDVLSSTTVIAFQIVIGFIAGFRQRKVFEMIDKLVQRMSPKNAEEVTNEEEAAPVMPAADPLGGGRSRR